MGNVILDALIDTLKLLPVLLIVNLLIELVERCVKAEKVNKILMGRAAPLWAATAGLLPQCGFGVVAAHLYSKKKLSLGTLLAVIIVTSDEAVSVLLSQPSAVVKLIPLLGIKFVFAIAVGFAVDAVIRTRQRSLTYVGPKQNEKAEGDCGAEQGEESEKYEENGEQKDEPLGCHHHEIVGNERNDLWHLIKHPILHTLSTLLFVFIVNAVIGTILFFVGDGALSSFLFEAKFIQPFIAAAIGLIPNCAASVAIAQMYALGHITLGAAVAGLSVSGGLALAVLIKENKNQRQNAFIIVFLFVICSLLGFAISFFE